MSAIRRLLVVSHPAVLPVNQLVYAELAQQGWEVHLAVPHRWVHEYGKIAPEPLPALRRRFYPLPVVFAGRPQRHFYLSWPRRLIERVKPDVVFVEQEPSSLAALQWAQSVSRSNIPFGVQAAENLDAPLPSPVKAYRAWVLRHASFVAARSHAAQRLARRFGASGRVSLIPHHVPDWPNRHRHSTSRFRVGFAGRLVPEKGISTLVEAVRKIDGGVELVVAGDGPLRDWLQSQDLGSASLTFMTNVRHDDMFSAYAAMDVLVLPSRTTPSWAEQFGRVLVEALSCGVPVVGSDSGEIPWVIEATRGGVVVPEGDASALAEALVAMRSDPERCRQYAEDGRSAVQRTFSVSAVARALDAALDLALPRRGSLRVALVAHDISDRGGMERSCSELIQRTCGEVEFIVVATSLQENLLPLVRRWVHIYAPRRPAALKFIAFWILAGRALRRLDCDLVHSVGAIIPNKVDLVSVYHCHAEQRALLGRFSLASDSLIHRLNTGVVRRIALLAERWAYRPSRTKLLVGSTDGLTRQLSRYFPRVRTAVVPNGVPEMHRLQGYSPSQRDQLRAGLSAHHATVVLLFLGGDWHRKGLPTILEAISMLEEHGIDLRLWVVGKGNGIEVEKRATSLGIRSRVTLIGQVEDVVPFYQAADIFVLASTYETFAIPCFEAAASGLPIIVTDVHGASDLVRDGGGGLLVDRTPQSVASAIYTLASDPDLRHRMGVEAKRRAAPFTNQRSADVAVQLYKDLVSESKVS